ncbi:hypothetical protein ACRW9N_08295 [Listeria aquatica]|uniref:hypothetical protein n=1 Tax=Listeria aquatica TaxID=1494960 RepID=UPI003EF3A1B0
MEREKVIQDLKFNQLCQKVTNVEMKRDYEILHVLEKSLQTYHAEKLELLKFDEQDFIKDALDFLHEDETLALVHIHELINETREDLKATEEKKKQQHEEENRLLDELLRADQEKESEG